MSVSDPPATPWHALDAAAVVARLTSDARGGLATAEAARRRAASGPNVIDDPVSEPWWRRLVAQFQELVIALLFGAAVVAWLLGEWADAAAILAIVVVNGMIGFLQERRARQALAALGRLAAPRARVVRDGTEAEIAARDVVPGDVLVFEAGDHVAADARLLEAHGLSTLESALTGESLPVGKDPRATLAASASLGDRATLVHAGTVVARGRGTAVVVAIGMRTELGRIAGLLEASPPVATPLERRLAELGRMLIAVCLAVVSGIAAIELVRGGGPWEVLLRSVSLAVAAVPEGLPAVVTLVLAAGLERMAARNALVRRLPSVETLGSVTVIGADKTGTLTRNEMTVRAVVAGRRRYRVTGAGYEPRGTFSALEGAAAGVRIDPRHDAALVRLLTIGARCNHAAVRPVGDGSRWEVVGDPTEGALLVAALKAGITVDDAPPSYELPCDSGRALMSIVARGRDGRGTVFTKGAPEAVLERCTHEYGPAGPEPLTPDRRAEILDVHAGLAGRALRVLGMASRPDAALPDPGMAAARVESGLVFAGLVGMVDPPRDGARAAVATCVAAGIRPLLITGDHPGTALAIARELGIVGPDGRVLTGAELDRLSSDRLAVEVGSVAVYARVTAEHKLRIVRAWQQRGEVVAMTGDGVNDAPAVQAADIGIAMGRTGTDVTRGAADLVLTDDNFASIVNAIEEGRGIYDNIRNVLHYLLACNAGEVLVMLVATLFGWPAPLAAIQILWLNLITDGLPALALGLEPPEGDLMRRPPRPPREPVLTRREGVTIALHGAVVAGAILAAFLVAFRGDQGRLSHARTITFCVAAFSQLLFAFACRSRRRTAWECGLATNPTLLAAVTVAGLLQVSVVTLPFARPVFEVGGEIGIEWAFAAVVSCLPLAVVEACKLLTADPAPDARPGGGHRPADQA